MSPSAELDSHTGLLTRQCWSRSLRRPCVAAVTILMISALLVAAHVARADSGFSVTAKLSHLGQVELTWPETTDSAIMWYTVHREEGTGSFPTSADNRVARVGLVETDTPRSPGFGDFGVEPNTTYTYIVIKRVSGGSPAGKGVVTITTGDRDIQQRMRMVAYGYEDHAGDVQVRWRAGDNATATTLTLRGGDTATPDDSWQTIGTYPVADKGVTLNNAPQHMAVVMGSSTTTFAVRSYDEPRLQMTPSALAELRDSVAVAGSTHAIAFDELKADVSKPLTEWESGGSYGEVRATAMRASDAALVYQITQDPQWAEQAHSLFVQAAAGIHHGGPAQPLFLGDVSTRLALAYDWSRHGWSAAQIRDAEQVLHRVAALWTTVHFANDLPNTKSSNWVGVTRSGEVLVRLALLGSRRDNDDVNRLAMVIDELRRHVDDAYGHTSYTHEGLAYWIYPMRGVAAAVLGMRSLGVTSLDHEMGQHRWTPLVLHALSTSSAGYRTQFGVDKGRDDSHQRASEFAALGLALAVPAHQGAARWLYDRVTGVHSAEQSYGGELGRQLTLLTYPDDVPAQDPQHVRAASAMLMDTAAGAFFVRNRVSDANDVLIGVFNRNHNTKGWDAPNTWALPIVGNGERWTRMPAKSEDVTRMSKPLIDGAAESTVGAGSTNEAFRFADSNGGYIELDASGNYGVREALREMVIDPAPRGSIDTIVAIKDEFSDTSSHTWTWQLSTTAEPSIEPAEDGLSVFVVQHGDAWLKGWFLPAPDQSLVTAGSPSRVQMNGGGPGQTFRVVLALGTGEDPAATRSGSTVSLAGQTFDLDNLSNYAP